MSSATTVVARKTDGKKPFEQRWNALAPEAQAKFYRMKCAEVLVPPRYAKLTPKEMLAIPFMRDSMKKMPNGNAHLHVEPLMSC